MDRIEIPPHITDIKLKIKETKLDLLIFRRPTRPVNGYRISIMIGFLKTLCNEADGDTII